MNSSSFFIWWFVGFVLLMFLLSIVDKYLEQNIEKKRRENIQYYGWYLTWIFLGGLLFFWQPVGVTLFLLSALIFHIYFARVYSRRNEKKYSFLDHLAGIPQDRWWHETPPPPRFKSLLTFIGLFLLLLPFGREAHLWFPVGGFFILLVSYYLGYQTELKKRSSSHNKSNQQ